MSDGSNNPVNESLFVDKASIFARKRDSLDEDMLAELARSVLKHASLIVRSPKGDGYEAPPDLLEAFCNHLLEDDPSAALDFIRERLARGLTSRDILFGYISAAARRLGEMWDADEISFVDVTVASGYLYGLIRASSESQAGARRRKYAVFATLPCEQHSLGVTVAAEVFREAGWQIDVFTGLSHEELVSRVSEAAPAILGLSISRKEQIPALSAVCVSIRLAVPATLIIAAGAGVAGAPDIQSVADVDEVFASADDAEATLSRLMWLRDQN